MILQRLVAALAVGLGVAASWIPPYKEYLQAMAEASETLEKNVLSMEGNIPLLNDSRRHYAEIIYVVHFHGLGASGGFFTNYSESYPIFLNISAPRAIDHPDAVVKCIKSLKADVHDIIDVLIELIDACVEESKVCNELIDETVRANQDQYGDAAEALVAAGNAARVLNSLNGEFEKWSNNLLGHAYVCSNPKDLERIVEAVAHLYETVEDPYGGAAVIHHC